MQERNSLIFGSHIFLFSMVFLGAVGVLTWWLQRGSVAEKRISFGEKSLISGPVLPRKQVGMDYIKAKDWIKAQDELKESLKKNPNDPEALIFFNNAKVHSTESDKSGSTESYTIAVSVPLPKYENNSLEILRGVAQAQDEINSPGKNKENKKILLKVAIASDDDDPEVAKQVATALADNRDVLGVVGHYASDVTLAAKNIYTSKKLVAITPISTSVCLTNTPTPISNSICSKDSDRSKNSKPYVFRTVPSDSDTAQALKIYMSQYLNKNNNVAILYNSDSNYSKSLACEFRNAVVDVKGQKCDFKNPDLNAKGQVREVTWYNLYDPNFNAALSVEQAINKGTQVLMLAANTSTLPKALEVVRSAKGKNLKIFAGDDVYTPDTLKEDAAVGMVVAAFWHIDSAPNSNFVKKSKELWGGATVNWRTALAYDATQALIKAIESNPNPNQSGVQQALLSPEFKANGASGEIEFLPSGDRKTAKVELVKIVCTNNSSTSCKFVPVALHKDKPSGDNPSSLTNNNPSPTPTPSPLPTATPTLTSTPTPSSSTTSLESDSVCRLQPESPESYKAEVVQREGMILRKEATQYSERLGKLSPEQRIIVLKEEKNKKGETWKNICVEVKGTKLEGWVKAKDSKGKDNTKKVGE